MNFCSFRVWVRKLSVQTHTTVLKMESHQLGYKISVSQIQNMFLTFWFLSLRIFWDFFLSCFLPYLGGQAKRREATVILKVLSAASTREEPSQPSLRSWHTWRVVSGVWWPGGSGWGTIVCCFLYRCPEQQERSCSTSRDEPRAKGYPILGQCPLCSPMGPESSSRARRHHSKFFRDWFKQKKLLHAGCA